MSAGRLQSWHSCCRTSSRNTGASSYEFAISSPPNSVGYDLHFAQDTPGKDGGRHVILVTDRPISFWEAANQPRSIEYPFTLIEQHVNRDGGGEGKMSIATRITGNREFNVIELEDYATQPVRLMAVRSSKPTS